MARPSGVHVVTKEGILSWLRDCGPIWCAGDWYGAGHIIVLTGISGDTIHINDPDDQKGILRTNMGRRGMESVAWFNQHLYWPWAGCLLHRAS